MAARPTGSDFTPTRAVPILLFMLVFSLVIDNGFKFMSLPISQDLNIPVTEVSLQATLAGLLIGIGAVVYAALADSIPIRKLIIFAILLMSVGSVAAVVRRWIRPSVKAPKSPTAGAPKRFAAAVGAAFTATATALWVLHLATGSSAALQAVVGIAVLMVLFPALESILGLCVGCVAFSRLIRIGLVPEEVCLECADIRRRAQVRAVA